MQRKLKFIELFKNRHILESSQNCNHQF